MDSVVVLNMKFLRKETTTIELCNTRDVYMYNFLVTDVKSQNPNYSIATAYGQPLSRNNNRIRDLNAFAEMFILTIMKEELETNNQRILLVIDLTNYPYISSYFDYRDQIDVNKDMDSFSQDIIRLWTNQTSADIPTILVNLNCTFTGLKLIPNPFNINTKK
jgi:hypothetical protein